METKSGDIEVAGKVEAQDTVSAKVTTGNIAVGEAVKAGNKVDLSVSEGKVTVGDGDKGSVTAGEAVGMNVGKGNIEIAQSVTSTNGVVDIDVADGNVTVGSEVIGKGSVTAEKDVTVNTGKGNVDIVKSVTSNSGNVAMTTGTGDIAIGDNVTAGDKVDLSVEDGNVTVGNKTTGKGTVTAQQDVNVNVGEGNVEIVKKVESTQGSIDIESGKGNIDIGDNGKGVETVVANQNVKLATQDGVIEVSGKTKTKKGDIIVLARDEDDTDNLIINMNGELDSGRDLTLSTYNGSIEVTDDTKAKQDLKVIVENKGSVQFNENVDVKGAVSADVKEGSITIGKTINAGKEIDMKTGSGKIEVGQDVTAGTTVDLTTGTGDITVGIGDSGNLRGNGDVKVSTGSGDVSINRTVTSTEGSINIASGNGKIHIGDNGSGPADLTVHAKEDIKLATQDGLIEVYGKTKTDLGDITVEARDKDNDKNLLIDFNGELDAASDATSPAATGNLSLLTYNGDIAITDQTKAKGDINAKVENKGSISFGKNVSTEGSLTFEVDDGNVTVGKSLTADKEITLASGKGKVEIGETVESKESSVSIAIGEGKVEIGGDVTAKKDVTITSGKGDIEIAKTTGSYVESKDSSVNISTKEGNIYIGDNVADDKTVKAEENVSLVTENGKIEVYGKTSTTNGDIILKASNPTYKAGLGGQNIIIDHNGQIASGKDATLIAKNGDLHVTDAVTAQRDINAITQSRGDVVLDDDLTIKGSVNMQTDIGDIVADKNVTAGNRVVAATKVGDITVGTADAKYVSLTSGNEGGNVMAGTIRAQANGNSNGTGAEDVKLGGSYVTVNTIVNKGTGSAPLTISTLGSDADKPMKDFNIGVKVANGVYKGGIQSASGAVVQELWVDRGMLYVQGDTNLHVSKLAVNEKLHTANDNISVAVFGTPPYHDGARVVFWNDTEKNIPSGKLDRWYNRSYADPAWMYLDLFNTGEVGSRYGVLMDTYGYNRIYGDSVSVVDTMRIRTEPISMVPEIVYFDRNNLIEISSDGFESDADSKEITVEEN